MLQSAEGAKHHLMKPDLRKSGTKKGYLYGSGAASSQPRSVATWVWWMPRTRIT